MTRSQRLLELLQLLRAYSYPVSASVLANKMGVTTLTIYRYIKTLREQGAEIVGERGIGYELRSDNHLLPLNFSLDIVLGLHSIRYARRYNLPYLMESLLRMTLSRRGFGSG